MSRETEHPAHRRPQGRVRRVLAHPPFRNAAVVVLIASVMGAVFASFYLDALGRPTARALAVGVVGPGAAQHPYVRALDAATSHGLVLTPYATAAQAERAVALQELYAVVVVGGDGAVTLETSSASGASVTRVLGQASAGAQQQTGTRLTTTDLHPLPPSDPSGLSAFYVTIAATIIGFIGTFQLRANARPLGLRAWLTATGALAVLGSLLIVVAGDRLLGLPLPFVETWWALALQMTTASAFSATMSVLIGRWALLPTWTVFILLGNTSSGGAVSPGLLPQPFAFLHEWLPSGATVTALRAAAYFPDTERWGPRLVLLAWAVVCLAALVLVCRRRGTSPGAAD
ncbi:DUF3533 domain-containing protein [Kineococcus rubinsiae]|uniref:DUF3533 domain-containing protein n=1 Tax=Kineococcus rubinsiae TaxID=2609562 RepID=UPI001431A21A|nr:DUF3533 domain-containing protein [Kineococcus rubinsiae]NIZ93607.1 DUF3533 domain-containing protein [Kineococcus rubinsiae]